MTSLLFSEESRQEFMNIVEGSVVNVEVLRRARFGNLLTMALFYDLQDPLFQKYDFDASDFLAGVQPALTNFHDTLGQLQNEFPEVTSKEERTEKLLQRMHQIVANSMTSQSNDGLALENNPWVKKAKEEPDSPAGRLSAMVVPKVLDSLYLTTETAAMLAKYKPGSAKVSNVALLSARVMEVEADKDGDHMDDEAHTTNDNAAQARDEQESNKNAEKHDEKKEEEEEITKMENNKESTSGRKHEGTDGDARAEQESTTNVSSSQSDADTTPVAAQIEVLYEMNQTIEVKPEAVKEVTEEISGQAPVEKPPTTNEEVQIWVGTFEGWLNGGPDGALRWKITRLRLPDSEFPGLFIGAYR